MPVKFVYTESGEGKAGSGESAVHKGSIARFGLIALVLAVCGTAQAADSLFDEKFAVSFGVYFMESDTRIRADSLQGARIGTLIDTNSVLGLEDEKVFRVSGQWHFLPRHQLRLMYFKSDRVATRTFSTEVNFGDAVFPASAEVRSDMTFEITELAYEFLFLRRESYELGASLGIHNMDFGLTLDGTVSSSGQAIGNTIHESVSTDAPLPVVGLRGMFRLAPKLYLQAHAQYFKLEIDDVDGGVQDYQAGLIWQATKYVGFGVGYNYFDLNVDVDGGERFQGNVDWKYQGAQLFLRASF